jgi:hypothetical protein
MTRYTPEPWKSAIDDFLSHLLTRCNDRAKARIKASALDDSWFVETYLCADGELQAYAGFEGGINVIDINLGTIFLLRDIFDQMLSHPLNFPHVGRANQEIVRRNYDPRRRTIDLRNIAQRTWQPIDIVRATYASELAIAAIDFLFHHELGHNFNGHIGLIRQGLEIARLPETGSILIPVLRTWTVRRLSSMLIASQSEKACSHLLGAADQPLTGCTHCSVPSTCCTRPSPVI